MTTSERKVEIIDCIRKDEYPTLILRFVLIENECKLLHSHPILRDSEFLESTIDNIMNKDGFVFFLKDSEGVEWLEGNKVEICKALLNFCEV